MGGISPNIIMATINWLIFFGLFGLAFGNQGTNILRGFKQLALQLITPNDEDFEMNLNLNEINLNQLMQNMEKMRYAPDDSIFFDILPKYQGKFPFNETVHI